MQKKGNLSGLLLKANAAICVIVSVGILAVMAINYRNNTQNHMENIVYISTLVSEGIYHRFDAEFTKPVNISLTMANDSLLKEHLSREASNLEQEEYTLILQDYLADYQKKYGYESVFLASTQSLRYYNFMGIDRLLPKGEEENDWFYQFLERGAELEIKIDNDEAAQDEITVFINARITDGEGNDLGVTGVGFPVDNVQSMLQKYEKEFDIQAFLIDEEGTIMISGEKSGYEPVDFFEDQGYEGLEDQIYDNWTIGEQQAYWFDHEEGRRYLVARLLPGTSWALLVEHDTEKMERQNFEQAAKILLIGGLILAALLPLTTGVIRIYNRKIIDLTVFNEQERQAIFRKATEEMYENIYEMNITENCAAGTRTEQYFESLGMPRKLPYDEVLKVIAAYQIKEEFRQGYIDTFSTQNVLREYAAGNCHLNYEFLFSQEGIDYVWIRIDAYIYLWEEDGSIRMFTYRKNIDEAKKREMRMVNQVESDGLTKTFNKISAENHIKEMLQENPDRTYAFFMFDIDYFKQVNDKFGHAFGDLVIKEFAETIRKNFRRGDILGRIGGDEFAVFVPCQDIMWARKKAQELVFALDMDYQADALQCHITTSIGVAMYPLGGENFEELYINADKALYLTKRRGRNGFTIWGED